MSTTPLKLLLLVTLTVFGGHVMARSSDSAVVWEREAALAATTGTDHEAMAREMLDLTIAGANFDLLNLLESTRTRTDWAEPARDAAVFRYVENLRELPSGTVDREVLTYLKAYPPNTLVPHEDHPSGLVPLFNVRAAASGLENGWKREEALFEGLALLQTNPESLADAFSLETDLAVRAGYRRALARAQPGMLASLNQAAAQRLAESPELTPLFADAASFSGDLDAHRLVVQAGQGAPVAAMLRQFVAQSEPSAQRQLLLESLADGPATNTALVMAELAPALIGDTAVDQALIEALADPQLGAGAALALSHSNAPTTLSALEMLAKSGSHMAATRARLALDLRQEHAVGERS